MYPNCIKELINNFKSLPGIGEKTAERLTFSLLSFTNEQLTNFSNSIIDLRDNIKYCSICGNITDKDICDICNDKTRDNSILFIVENAKDIIFLEKLGIYKGKYHVLNGLISPLDGIGPEDLNIDSLIKRIENNSIKEIIFTLKPSIEGETTMQYLKTKLEKYNLKITKIATGVPIGTDIGYIDPMTLEFALDERKDI